jgi:hypothetical protein
MQLGQYRVCGGARCRLRERSSHETETSSKRLDHGAFGALVGGGGVQPMKMPLTNKPSPSLVAERIPIRRTMRRFESFFATRLAACAAAHLSVQTWSRVPRLTKLQVVDLNGDGLRVVTRGQVRATLEGAMVVDGTGISFATGAANNHAPVGIRHRELTESPPQSMRSLF